MFLARLSSSLSNFWIRALSQQLIRAARRSPLGSNGPGGPGKPQGDHSTGARGRGMSHPQERKSRKQQKWGSSTSTGAGKIERRCQRLPRRDDKETIVSNRKRHLCPPTIVLGKH